MQDTLCQEVLAKLPQPFKKRRYPTLREKLGVFHLHEFINQNEQPQNLIPGLAGCRGFACSQIRQCELGALAMATPMWAVGALAVSELTDEQLNAVSGSVCARA